MRSLTWSSAARWWFLLASTQWLPVSASPPINVDLQASFNSAPYIIELLETAAEEKPDAYFPLLDAIADGYFNFANTEKDLYDNFLILLKNSALITDPESLSSFQFALSIRSSAPRIEAHYQYYNTTIAPLLDEKDCPAWLEVGGQQYCDPQMEKAKAYLKDSTATSSLPFDRQLGPEGAIPVTLYADISSKEFREFHWTASNAAHKGKSAYRVRYKPSTTQGKPLVMSGYGVELALKRTDYIVLDDRPKGEESSEEEVQADKAQLDDEEVADMKPLSRSEVQDLSMKAACFVVNSEKPLEMLLKLTQDFPKHSAYVSGHNASEEFVEEYQYNREQFLPPGYNVMWVNGVQYDPRKVDAFSLLDYLRRERRLISNFQNMGLTSAETITLLSNPALIEAFSQLQTQSQRYDWRDETEGGDVIIWLNDIEKDKRYKGWPSDLDALLQRMFPGQLPSVRRDIFNAIVPVDFSKPESAFMVVQTIQNLIKRKVPVRWGIVPLAMTDEAKDQARVFYYLQESYGLVAAINYFEKLLEAKQKVLLPHPPVFQSVIESRTVKEGKEQFENVQKVLANEDLDSRVQKASRYLERLGALRERPPVFVNGVPIKQDDDWLQGLSQRVSIDLRQIQQGIFEGTLPEDTWVPSLFLNGSSIRRNDLVIPENDKDVSLVNLPIVLQGHEEEFKNLATIPVAKGTEAWESTRLVVIADLNSPEGLLLAGNATLFRNKHSDVELVFIHNANPGVKSKKAAQAYDVFKALSRSWSTATQRLATGFQDMASEDFDTESETKSRFPALPELVSSLRLEPGQSGVLLNGRKIGPIPSNASFVAEDLEMLLSYEATRRIVPAKKALEALQLTEKIADASAAAKLYSLVAVSQVSDIPEGIFELPPLVRTNMFYDWQDEHTTITHGSNSTAAIQIIISLDPASEVAQRWAPIIKVLTELEGVFLRIYMNPKPLLEELPVKRFYRYVLEAAPSFDDDGSLIGRAANFNKIPAKALLTLGMDVPAAWLVASKESIHDLDNIKLSSLGPNGRVDATYQLEYVLIEGHSRDITTEGPPRGAQLVLSTATDPHVADTIIMSNLGYFQFKANPGYYNIGLKAGPSNTIFHIDSVGSLGYEPQPGDKTTEVALLSFQGVTLYPRLSRNKGQEEEDVLEAGAAKPDLVQQGANMVGNLLQKAGIAKAKPSASVHADINIFSVASGHLYERMLSIMMVSVMRHTKHTVKFWFIEQFLSPSFKSFVPTLAKEYGFQYEMVTYKWPHWLRAQKEKQREIWGYKILFLDVLFPLDLDKVIFVDADQIVRTDMMELNNVDLKGAPYGFTPMCDSRTEMEGYRFWKQGYWKNFLRGLPYHISALYVVDLKRFRALAAGDRLRQQYHQLSADPHSLSNLDQDLPNNMQQMIPIHSLDQNWLWCETWCSDEALGEAKTIDLCNNPETKEPKLERARRQVPEWTVYDEEIAELARKSEAGGERPVGSVQEDELDERKEKKKVESEKEKKVEGEKEKKKKSKEKDEL